MGKGKAAENRIYVQAESQIEFRQDLKGKTFGIVCLSSKISITAYNLLRAFSEMEYIVIVSTYQGINGKLSCRSREGFDCRDLSLFEGHKQAAGGEVDPDLIKEFLDNPEIVLNYDEGQPPFIYKKEVLR